jgi:hypothetical protein
VLPNGTVTNEGCLSGWRAHTHASLGKFDIPYRVMVPSVRGGASQHESASATKSTTTNTLSGSTATGITNLLVTAAVSASHVGSGPLRLEPQYMNLGHAAGVASHLLVTGEGGSTMQAMDVGLLQKLLVAQGVTIHAHSPPSPTPSPPPSPPTPMPAQPYACFGGDAKASARCVISPSDGKHSDSSCMGKCTPLGEREWLGSRSAWDTQDAPLAVAKKPTHLKKSTALSSGLPPSMVRAEVTGSKCTMLNITGTGKWDTLFLCALPSRQ